METTYNSYDVENKLRRGDVSRIWLGRDRGGD